MEQSSDEYLVSHYRGLGDLRADFRNWNLVHLVASLVSGRRAVDVGCGSGLLLSILKEKGKDVLGVESSKGMVALASRLDPAVPIVMGRAEDIESLVRDRADTVIMMDVLEHIEKDAEQVRKVGAILDEGGEFIVVVPAYRFLYGQRDRSMGHFRRYSKEMLVKLLGDNGFMVQRVRYWNALGVLPYFFYEKILRKSLETKLRSGAKKGFIKRVIQKILQLWFKFVENNFNLGFGLTIICVAKKAGK